MTVDLRSDTVTKPTPAMRACMASAEVGDDVFGEDPSVNDLEHRAAALFGMDSALFCPSGTMTNQIAIKSHTEAGDEVICDADSHIYLYEGGGVAFNSGCSMRLLPGDRGRLTASQVEEAVNNPDDVHKPLSRLVSLENTSNRGGGSCYDWKEVLAIREVCRAKGLALHLDGARLFNALVATGQDPKDYGATFDSISICLSKGLGAPVGSLLLGRRDFIRKARRIRKVFGGGMRQAGFMAAAGLYALDNHLDRLEEDHRHARAIAEALRKKDFIGQILPVETNIVIAETLPPWSPAKFAARMKERGVLLLPFSPTRFRMVLHLDVTPDMLDHTIRAVEEL
jgi:threonine aldolase